MNKVKMLVHVVSRFLDGERLACKAVASVVLVVPEGTTTSNILHEFRNIHACLTIERLDNDERATTEGGIPRIIYDPERHAGRLWEKVEAAAAA